MRLSSRQLAGMRAFVVVWAGQVFSLFGTAMSGFALTIWAWQLTGQATALALVGFFHFGPTVLLSPVAGALVDRWNRKLVMMLSDIASGVSTAVILALYLTGKLEIWHLYVTGAFSGAFQAFQWPAYSAAITMMLPKEQYARAGGMISLAQSGAEILAPLAAGLLLGVIGIAGILAVDLVSLAIAVAALLIAFIPQPPATAAGLASRGNLWQESLYGFRYILARPSLLGLQLVFFGFNLVATLAMTVFAPMILARSGNNPAVLGTVQSFAGAGGVIGSLALSVWGGPKRRVHGVLVSMALSSLLGVMLLGVSHILPLWAAAGFFASFFTPFANGSNQAIWQAKVDPDVQGRVFAVRRLIAQITAPLAMLAAGPLADRVFEPGMQHGGALSSAFGWLVGEGPGAGMALMQVIFGLLGVAVALGGYLFPAVRHVEDIVPDHAAASAPAAG